MLGPLPIAHDCIVARLATNVALLLVKRELTVGATMTDFATALTCYQISSLVISANTCQIAIRRVSRFLPDPPFSLEYCEKVFTRKTKASLNAINFASQVIVSRSAASLKASANVMLSLFMMRF